MKYEEIEIIYQFSCQISNVALGKDLNIDSFYCVWTQWKKNFNLLPWFYCKIIIENIMTKFNILLVCYNNLFLLQTCTINKMFWHQKIFN